MDEDLLLSLEIKYILDISGLPNLPLSSNFEYKIINHVQDRETEKIIDHFDECIEFINICKNNNARILVHCNQGISRSASIVLSYLIKEMGMTLKQAWGLTFEKRKMIRPNDGFLRQLIEWEKSIYNRSTLTVDGFRLIWND